MRVLEIRTFVPKAVCVLAIVFTLTATGSAARLPPEDQKQAEALWEAAIAARGGRERLHEIKSLLLSYNDTVRNFVGLVVHRGTVEVLYVFPDKSWGWDDGLPPPFSLSVMMLNVERNQRCVVHRGSAKPTCGPARQAGPPNEGITQVQYLYLMETKWVRPSPYSVTRDSIGLSKVDVLHTRFENKRIDYYLDRKTHLPRRVAIFYGNSERATLKLDFSEYVNIDGVQMPSKQKRGKISFELNPDYDESIFTHAPSIDAGPHAWRKP